MDSNPTPDAPAPAPAPEATTPAPAAAAPAAAPSAAVAVEDPGKTLGIVSFILSLVGVGLVGLILGIVAQNKSKAVGRKNGFALAGIILGILGIVGVIFWTVIAMIAAASGVTTVMTY